MIKVQRNGTVRLCFRQILVSHSEEKDAKEFRTEVAGRDPGCVEDT